MVEGRVPGCGYPVVNRVILDLASRMDDYRCAIQSCAIARDVFCLSMAFDNQLGGAGHAAHVSDAAFEAAIHGHDRVVSTFGRRHPERIPAYCDIMARVAAATTGDFEHDGHSVRMIVSAYRNFRAPPPSCGARILAAFPDAVAVQDNLRNAGGACALVPVGCRAHPAMPTHAVHGTGKPGRIRGAPTPYPLTARAPQYDGAGNKR